MQTFAGRCKLLHRANCRETRQSLRYSSCNSSLRRCVPLLHGGTFHGVLVNAAALCILSATDIPISVVSPVIVIFFNFDSNSYQAMPSSLGFLPSPLSIPSPNSNPSCLSSRGFRTSSRRQGALLSARPASKWHSRMSAGDSGNTSSSFSRPLSYAAAAVLLLTPFAPALATPDVNTYEPVDIQESISTPLSPSPHPHPDPSDPFPPAPQTLPLPLSSSTVLEIKPQWDVHSIDSRSDTFIMFDNDSNFVVDLLWIDYYGHEVYYTSIFPGSMHMQPSYATHPWVVREHISHKPILVMIATPRPALAVVHSA